jgi:drug/metabolite transporter (DMT)-like permease
MTYRSLTFWMFLAMIAWGSTWVSAKILMEGMGAYQLIFWRFLLSAMGLIPVIWLMGHSWKIDRRELLIVLLAGLGLILYNRFFFLGTHLGEAGLGGVLVTTLNPILTFIFIALLSRKLLRQDEWFALILGALGTLTILKAWNYGLEMWRQPGVLYFITAAATWPWITILSARFKEGSPLVLSFYMFLITALGDWALFLDFQIPALSALHPIEWLNLLSLSLYGTTFGTSIYFLAASRWGGAKASGYFFLVPFSAALFAALFLHEEIGLSTVIGGLFTLLAVYQLNGYNLLGLNQRIRGWLQRS